MVLSSRSLKGLSKRALHLLERNEKSSNGGGGGSSSITAGIVDIKKTSPSSSRSLGNDGGARRIWDSPAFGDDNGVEGGGSGSGSGGGGGVGERQTTQKTFISDEQCGGGYDDLPFIVRALTPPPAGIILGGGEGDVDVDVDVQQQYSIAEGGGGSSSPMISFDDNSATPLLISYPSKIQHHQPTTTTTTSRSFSARSLIHRGSGGGGKHTSDRKGHSTTARGGGGGGGGGSNLKNFFFNTKRIPKELRARMEGEELSSRGFASLYEKDVEDNEILKHFSLKEERERLREHKIAEVWYELYEMLQVRVRVRQRQEEEEEGDVTTSEMQQQQQQEQTESSSSSFSSCSVQWDEFRTKFAHTCRLVFDENDDIDRVATDIVERKGGPANATLLYYAYEACRQQVPPRDVILMLGQGSCKAWMVGDDAIGSRNDTPIRRIFDELMGYLGGQEDDEGDLNDDDYDDGYTANSDDNTYDLDPSSSSGSGNSSNKDDDGIEGIAWQCFLETFSATFVPEKKKKKKNNNHNNNNTTQVVSKKKKKKKKTTTTTTKRVKSAAHALLEMRGGGALENTLLHAVCRKDPPTKIVRLLLDVAAAAAAGDGGDCGGDDVDYDVYDDDDDDDGHFDSDMINITAAKNKRGYTPLHEALSRGGGGASSSELISILVNADISGESVMTRDYVKERTPLHLAITNGRDCTQTVKLILDCCSRKQCSIDVSSSTTTTTTTTTPLCETDDGVDVFGVGGGGVVAIRDKYGETALHCAIRLCASTETIEMLIEAAASSATCHHDDDDDDKNDDEKKRDFSIFAACDAGGKIPLLRAIENGLSTEIVSELVSHSSREDVLHLLELIVDGSSSSSSSSPSSLALSSSFEKKEIEEIKPREQQQQQHNNNNHHHHHHHEEDLLQKQRRRRKEQRLSVDVATRYYPCLAAAVTKCRDMQRMLNERSSERIFSALLMMDLYSRVFLIIGYCIVSDVAVRSLSFENDAAAAAGGGGEEEEEEEEEYSSFFCWFYVLYGLGAYLILREVFQIGTQGMNWFFDESNWLDVVNISLLLVSTVMMENVCTGNTDEVEMIMENEGFFRGIIMATGAILWMEMLSFLSSTFLPFSVFVSGVTNILWKITPFLISSFCVLGAFVHMYYVDSVGTNRCERSTTTAANYYDGENSVAGGGGRVGGGEDSKFCTYEGSLVKVYSMFVGGTDEYLFTNGAVEERNWRNAERDFTYSTLGLSVLFGLLVQILLLNVLIVIVNESWDDVSRNGAEVFWENRLHFLSEVKSIRVGKTMQFAFHRVWNWMVSVEHVFSYLCSVLFVNKSGGGGGGGGSAAKAGSTAGAGAGGGSGFAGFVGVDDLFYYMTSLKQGGFVMDFCADWISIGRRCRLRNRKRKGKKAMSTTMMTTTSSSSSSSSSVLWIQCVFKRILLLLQGLYQCIFFIAISILCILGGFVSLGAVWPQSFRRFLFGSNTIDEHSNEMSKEVKRIHERCDVLEKKIDLMLKENHALLRKKKKTDFESTLFAKQMTTGRRRKAAATDEGGGRGGGASSTTTTTNNNNTTSSSPGMEVLVERLMERMEEILVVQSKQNKQLESKIDYLMKHIEQQDDDA